MNDPEDRMDSDTQRTPQRDEMFSRGKDEPDKRQHWPWLGGAILILIGIILLVGQFTDYHLNNWWALFILIPAVSAFANAWGEYNRHRRITKGVRGGIVSGIILTFLTLVFLLGLDFSRLWPVFLIVGGLSMLLSALIKDEA